MYSLIKNIWNKSEFFRLTLTYLFVASMSIVIFFILRYTVWYKPIKIIKLDGVYVAERDNAYSLGALTLKDGKRINLYCNNPKETISKGYRSYLSCPDYWIPSVSLNGMNAEAHLDKNSGMSLFSLYINGVEIISAHEAKKLYGIR